MCAAVDSGLILWKLFSVWMHRSVSYRIISQQVLKLEKTSHYSRTGSYSFGITLPFWYTFFPTVFEEEKLWVLLWDVSCHWLNLRAAGHGRADNTLLSVSFFTVKCTLDWQLLAPEGEMPCLKSIA